VGPEVGDDGDGDGFAAAARSAAGAGAEGVFAAGEPCADPFADDGAVDADDSGDGDAAGALLEEEDGLLAAFEEGFWRESAGVAQLDGHGVSEACGVPWRRESSGVLWRLWKEWRNGADPCGIRFRCKQGDILKAHL